MDTRIICKYLVSGICPSLTLPNGSIRYINTDNSAAQPDNNGRYRVHTKAIATCMRRYYRYGREVRTCMNDGTWNHADVRCLPGMA